MLRCVLLLAALNAAACGQKEDFITEKIISGDYFPEIELTGLEGNTTSFSVYKGKLVVLNIWATWCPPCRRELPSLERLGETLDKNRFAVILLSIDSDEHVVREYLIDVGLKTNTFIDKKVEIAGQMLGAVSYPVTYLISRQGKVMQVVYGEKEWDSPVMIEKLEHAFSSGIISI